MAGVSAIFTSGKLLLAAIVGDNKDGALMAKLRLRAMVREEWALSFSFGPVCGVHSRQSGERNDLV